MAATSEAITGPTLTAAPRPVPAPAPVDEVTPTATTHSWFAVIWVIYLIDYADRFAISAVLPAIQQEFALNDTQLGLMSGSLFLGLAILAVPSGLAVDRFSRKYMITLMTLVWSAATWWTGMAKTFGGLVAARIMVGAGEAGYNPAGYALIAAWYPQRLRGTMVGLFNMAQPLGMGLGVILAGHLAAQYGWRAVFGLLALPGVILALLMLFAPDYKTRKVEPDGSKTIKPGLRDTVTYITGNRTLQLIYLAQLPIAVYVMSLAIWGPTLFVRQYGLSLADAASMVGVVTMVAGFGAVCGGWYSDRVSRGNPGARVTVCVLFLAVPLALHSVAFIGGMVGFSLPVVVSAFCIGQFFAAANWGTLVAASLDQSPPPYRASCQSFLPMFQAVAGLGAGVVSGLLSNRVGLPMALEILLVVGMLSAILILRAARRHYDEDYRRQGELGTIELELQ